MGVPWPQLGGSIRQLALLVSALGWVCPAWQMSLSFLQERLGGQQSIGRGGKPCLATRATFPGAQQAAGRPPLRTPATRAPDQLLESLRRCHPFLFRVLFSPRAGRKYLVQSGLGTGSQH